MKNKIITFLKGANGEFISGQRLSEEFHVSRTAIWKHINQLKEEGYEIESVTKTGYKLLSSPDILNANELTEYIKTKRMGRFIHHFESVSSTQQLAHDKAKEGALEGTIIVAEQQTAGKGRLGRSWHSPKGSGIWCSMVIRPEITLQQAPQLTLLTAVAITRAIIQQTQLDVKIKWPNDLLIEDKKFCGILTELNGDADQIHYIIIGFGLNINLSSKEFPLELEDVATSLSIEARRHISRVELLASILTEFETLYELYLQVGFSPIKLLWEAHSLSLGQQIIARTLQRDIYGIAKGIDDQGVLMIETKEGKVERVYSADIKRYED